ncbi:MAG: hypothetical protein H5T62_08980 [Anaerolineae bacterium]|nr:hypothetical protein [Anaerolineae bacterium]
MTQIVVVTHGRLGEELLRTAEMILGPQEGVHVVSLLAEERPETLQDKLDAVLQRVGADDTLILLDFLGGTPYNAVARCLRDSHIECVTGVNLPLLLEILSARDAFSAADLAQMAVRTGREAIKNLKPLLGPASDGA